MTNILVFFQHNEAGVLKASLSALSAALEIKQSWGKGDLIGICLGKGAIKAADQALSFGISKCFYSEDPALEKYLSVPYAAYVIAACSEAQCDTVIAAATSSGKDFMPRVAADLGAAQASDIIGVNNDKTLKRPTFAGNVLADVELLTEKRCITVRPTGFGAATPGAATGSKVEIKASFDPAIAGEVLSYEISGGERPELSDAEVVVSGGRALQSEENFAKYIFPLADALGAAVGASRAAVDSGYAPNDWQVGQTGKVVAPKLYIAVGISGAIQHVAGMKDSKVIVAINSDADAPIFEIADYGLVGDLYQIVPELTEAIKKGT